MEKRLDKWPALALVLVPILIGVVDAAVLIGEHLQPETDKAIRLVRESKSRKENFTVQQYLYTTVYHREARGEGLVIHGWRAEQPQGPGTAVVVEFSYTDGGGRRFARWRVEPGDDVATPMDETANDISWH